MKARKRNSNDDWKEVEYVQLRDSYVITKADQMEFDIPHKKEQTESEHWQNVRERAAIAALQGILTWGEDAFSYEKAKDEIVKAAIEVADALIEELKKQN